MNSFVKGDVFFKLIFPGSIIGYFEKLDFLNLDLNYDLSFLIQLWISISLEAGFAFEIAFNSKFHFYFKWFEIGFSRFPFPSCSRCVHDCVYALFMHKPFMYINACKRSMQPYKYILINLKFIWSTYCFRGRFIISQENIRNLAILKMCVTIYVFAMLWRKLEQTCRRMFLCTSTTLSTQIVNVIIYIRCVCLFWNT